MFDIGQSGDGIGNSFLVEIPVCGIVYEGTEERMYLFIYLISHQNNTNPIS